MPPDYVPVDAEDVTDHGISVDHNPNDPDLSTAIDVHSAIQDAADAAGDGGSIYFPEGTYHFGNPDSNGSFNVRFLDGGGFSQEISIYGDGPTKSTVALTEHLDPDDDSHTMFYYRDGTGAEVTVRDIRIDGNGQNIDADLLIGGTTRAERGWILDGSTVGHMNVYNVHFAHIINEATRNNNARCTFDRCTFEHVGVYSRNAGASGHAIETHAASGETTVIKNCKFDKIGSFCVNHRFNEGTLDISNCWSQSVSNGFIKPSAGAQHNISNVYHEGYTTWTQNNITNTDFQGRFFYDKTNDREAATLVTDMQDVEIVSLQGPAMRHSTSADASWTGTNIAIKQAALDNVATKNAIATESTGNFTNVSITDISVHDTDGDVFDTTGSDGTIDTLHRNNNTALGDSGSITITTDNTGGSELSPDVPSENEVGINSEAVSATANVGVITVNGVRGTVNGVIDT